MASGLMFWGFLDYNKIKNTRGYGMREIIKIDEATWRIEDDYVRFFVLSGSEKALMIDSGVFCENAKAKAEELTGLPVILANTHGDGDHISGTGSFDEIYMHEADYSRVALRFPDVKLVPLKEGDNIDLGGRTIRIIEIPGHTKGSIAFLDVERRRLFAGDSVQNGHIYMFGPHRDPSAFENSLNKLIGLKAEYDSVIASHGEPELLPDYVSKVLNAWKQLLAGKLTGKEIELHGMKVNSYDANDCGFFY